MTCFARRAQPQPRETFAVEPSASSRAWRSRAASAVSLLIGLAFVVAGPRLAHAMDGQAPTDVRRWEHVLAVRTSSEFPETIGRVERAAFKAGGAVLEILRSDYTPAFSDYRLLVRTARKEVIGTVMREVGRQVGVVGVAVVQLPETPTVPGGPSFMSSYTADTAGNPSTPGVLVHHELPPVVDKRDLLDVTDVPMGPGNGVPTGVGGLTLNLSELFKNWKENAWRKREERMKNAHLPILPPEGETTGDEAAPPTH
jgi:hypothetical protein